MYKIKINGEELRYDVDGDGGGDSEDIRNLSIAMGYLFESLDGLNFTKQEEKKVEDKIKYVLNTKNK